ncbi:MAG TPA: nuclear transport factor 2 family protein [Blastocatellia bacterium]|nr:nuclear transport factor 2 family protein [Blastocatellia bacterium]
MKRNMVIALLGIAALAFGSTSSSFSQKKDKASSNSKAEAEVLQVINERRTAIMRGEDYGHLLADDFLATGNSLTAITKEQVIEGFKKARHNYQLLTHTDLKVRVYGDTAVVTYISTWKRTTAGQEMSGQSRFIHVLVKQHGRWQIVSTQGTAVESAKN